MLYLRIFLIIDDSHDLDGWKQGQFQRKTATTHRFLALELIYGEHTNHWAPEHTKVGQCEYEH